MELMLSKRDLAIVLAVAGLMLWTEHAHRTSIGTPLGAEAQPVSDCPEKDSVPFSTDCIAFIDGGGASDEHPQWRLIVSRK
jgi:hypothetical protein